MTYGIRARSWTGLALARARADIALVAVSALVVVVAATVMVATAVHPAASASRSAVRALEAADPGAASVVVTTDVRPADAAVVDGKVRTVLANELGPMGGTVVRSARSESWGVPGAVDSSTPIAVFGSVEGMRDRLRLVAGSWPAVGGTGASGSDVAVVLTQAAADRLGLDVGGRMPLASRLDPNRHITVILSGIVDLVDRGDPAWAGDPLALDGSTTVGPFTTAGPLFTDDTALSGLVMTRATTTWVAIPTFAGLPAAALPGLAASTGSIPDRLTATLGRSPAIVVTTKLPALLAEASAALDRAGSGSTAIAGPLVAIALYALVLVAALIVDRRRASTTLLRARGAGSGALVRLALVEAVLLAVAASMVGVPLGVLVVLAIGGSEGWGTGFLPPTVSGWSVAAVAAATAVAATAALMLPTLGSAGPLARLRRLARSRPGSTAATRSGLDLALLAVAALLLWQLRSGGAGAASGRGLGTLDMAAPALALLAGSVLSLRLTGFAARVAGAIGGRARGALPAIAGRSVARRADAHARVALLVVAAVATALLCASLGRSWTIAQRDQAAHNVAADVAGDVHTVVGASRAGAAAAYRAVPGVTRVSGVIGAAFDAGASLRRGRLLAVPADPALAEGALRADLADQPISGLLAGLAAARPELPAIPVPSGTTRLRVAVAAHLHLAGAQGEGPGGVAASLRVALVVMGPDGMLTRTDSTRLTDDGTAEIALPGPAAAVVAVETEVTPTGGTGASGTIRVAGLDAAGPSDDWTPLDLRSAVDGWAFTRTAFGVSASPLGSAPGAADTSVLTDEAPAAGPGATVVAFRPAALATLAAQPMRALADPAFLAAAPPGLDDTRTVKFNLADTRRFAVAATVASFPGVDATGLLVVDLGTWQLVGYGASGTVPDPTTWWLATDGADDPAVARAVSGGAYPLEDVRSLAADVATRLDNPIADAVLGSLGAVGAGAVLIAVLGVAAASAQGARARRGEVAVIRAQGLAGRSLAGWLLADEAFPIAAGLAGGVALGVAVAALVVPALVHALDGVPAVPPVAVAQPLDLALALAAGGGALAILLALARLRATLLVRLSVTLRADAPGAEA